MSYAVQVLPEATEEVAAIFAYYEGEKPGLGHRFQQALNECYQSLALNPSGQKRKGGLPPCDGPQVPVPRGV
ncbi:MAG: hypothetical protein GFGODING_00827 [Flavobacteriales bacterium]|nr:hypothetical protein [Flavobacteriales bacterium]